MSMDDVHFSLSVPTEALHQTIVPKVILPSTVLVHVKWVSNPLFVCFSPSYCEKYYTSKIPQQLIPHLRLT